MRLTRPLIARRLNPRRGLRAPLAPEWKSGPFSYLVTALDGLPVAAPLRQLIDAALDSPLLPRRAKLLVFAVVARGLGCQLSEREAANLLAAEGLEAEPLDDILSHLGSPELDPVEALIVPFARETIWYRTAPIQRRARALAERLGDGQFLEVVGIASVGNMLSRLAIVLDLP